MTNLLYWDTRGNFALKGMKIKGMKMRGNIFSVLFDCTKVYLYSLPRGKGKEGSK